jgi:hypothetical protein
LHPRLYSAACFAGSILAIWLKYFGYKITESPGMVPGLSRLA